MSLEDAKNLKNKLKVTDILIDYHNAKQWVDHYNKLAIKLFGEAQDTCTHSDVRKERDYHEGGYDYTSSVTIRHVCNICDKVLQFYSDPNHKGHYN